MHAGMWLEECSELHRLPGIPCGLLGPHECSVKCELELRPVVLVRSSSLRFPSMFV
jgi:hypothetical protein